MRVAQLTARSGSRSACHTPHALLRAMIRYAISPPVDQTAPAASSRGEVAEWLNAPHSKCGVGATPPGVRIPPSPPFTSDLVVFFDLSGCLPPCWPPCELRFHLRDVRESSQARVYRAPLSAVAGKDLVGLSFRNTCDDASRCMASTPSFYLTATAAHCSCAKSISRESSGRAVASTPRLSERLKNER
jgi:hypothetical protein